MTIEDAAALSVMLPKGTTPSMVPVHLQLYNKARYERVCTVQNNSRMVGDDGVQKEATAHKFKLHEVIDHGLSHDEIHASAQILREHRWEQNPHAFWRQPVVFGLMPGPRQDSSGIAYHPSSPASSVTATIIFRTSATLLRTLFPNSSYRFAKTDTVAVASFSVQTLKNLHWLAGGGYDLLGLYFHDVQYTTSTGEIVQGTYCPVMFENLADPILFGREELGFPKLFSDIAIDHDDRSKGVSEARVSWRGAEWAKLSWKDLKKRPQEAVADVAAIERTTENSDRAQPVTHDSTDGQDQAQGLFVHKCVPVSDMVDRGKHRADAEYDVFYLSYFGAKGTKTTKILKAAHADVNINDLGFQKLPTLHHIVKRLMEIPVFEVMVASIVEAEGIGDLLGARRLK
ncbi:hypothetical protein MMC13_000208 [Lambiella insularis]|nr:hypothetical protein [Lambiella insularis]